MLTPTSRPLKKLLFYAVMALLSATLVSSAVALEIHVSPTR